MNTNIGKLLCVLLFLHPLTIRSFDLFNVFTRCSVQNKLYSFWILLACENPFHISTVVLKELDKFGDDTLETYTHLTKYNETEFIINLQQKIADDEVMSSDYYFFIEVNSTCNARRQYEVAVSRKDKSTDCGMHEYGPHPVFMYLNPGKTAETQLESEEIY